MPQKNTCERIGGSATGMERRIYPASLVPQPHVTSLPSQHVSAFTEPFPALGKRARRVSDILNVLQNVDFTSRFKLWKLAIDGPPFHVERGHPVLDGRR